MDCSHTYDPVDDVVITTVTGDVTIVETGEGFSETVALAAEHGCTRLLNDFCGAKVDLSMSEMLRLSSVLEEVAAAQGVSLVRLKRANVMPREIFAGSGGPEYLENIFSTYGHFARNFEGLDEAREWLLG